MELKQFKTVEQLAAAVKSMLLEDMMANKGWFNSAWQKDPLRFGYSGLIYESIADTNLGAGTVSVDSAAVSPGEIWVITNIAVSYEGTVATVEMQMQIDHNGTRHTVAEFGSITSGLFYDRQGFWVLDTSDFVRLSITNATATDDGFLRIIGYRVDHDQ